MKLIIIKSFLILVICLFIIGLIVPVILLRKKGIDPHGTHEGGSILTKLTLISITAWLIYILLYIFLDRSTIILHEFDFFSNDFFIVSGMILVSIGFLFELLAMVKLGSNFRIELPKEQTVLITTGIYRLMRNPILVGIYLLLAGSLLVIPTLISLILLIANIITFNSKAKDEEKFLSQRFGEDYELYRSKVGRYLPFTFKREKIRG